MLTEGFNLSGNPVTVGDTGSYDMILINPKQWVTVTFPATEPGMIYRFIQPQCLGTLTSDPDLDMDKGL